MAFDDVLRDVGDFGFYQKMLFMLLLVAGIDKGWQQMAMTFLGARMDHWCKTERLQNFSYEKQKQISIPLELDQSGSSVYSSCKVYPLNYSSFSDEQFRAWNRTEMTTGLTPVTCTSWVFDQSIFISTVVSQFDLVCGRSWLLPLTNTIYMGGCAVGVLVCGYFSDRFGRLNTYVFATLLQIISQTTAAFSVHYVMFVCLRFLGAAACMGAYNCGFVMIMEVVGAKYRVPLASSSTMAFALGFSFYPAFAYAVRDHQKLQLVMSLPVIVFLSYWWLLPESPRWLVSRGRTEEATAILKKIAEINGRELPAEVCYGDANSAATGDREVATIWDALRYPNLRKRTMILSFIWFTVSLVFYGVSLGANNLAGDIFINTLLLAVTGIPATFICILALMRLGRRTPFIVFILIGGVMCLGCIPFFYVKNMGAAVTVLSMLGKMGIGAAFSEAFIFTTELYPTSVRNAGLGATSLWARISSMVAPQINQLITVWRPLPSLIYGVFGVVAAAMALLLPETRGKRLPETLLEGEAFGTAMYETVLAKRTSSNGFHKLDKDVNKTHEPTAQVNQGFRDDEKTTDQQIAMKCRSPRTSDNLCKV